MEVKPVKLKKINNKDGGYIIKEVYNTPNFGHYLSDIEIYDNKSQFVNGQYFSDKNFRILIYSEKREYSESGEYTRIQTYEQEQDGWKVVVAKVNSDNKVLSKLFYKDDTLKDIVIQATIEYFEDGTSLEKQVDYSRNYSCIVKKDNKNRPIEEVDGDAKYTVEYANYKYFYNEDGSYMIKSAAFSNELNDLPRFANSYYNALGQLTKAEIFYDENCKYFHSELEKINNNDGSYIEKYKYNKPDENGWLSTIEKFNSNSVFYYGEYYSDDKFSDLGLIQKRKYKKDGARVDLLNYKDVKYKGWLSACEKYNQNSDFIYGIYYKKDNFKQLDYEIKRVESKDNSYIDYYKYPKDDFPFIAQYYNEKGEKYCTKWFKDSKFKHECAEALVEISDGTEIKKVVYDGVLGGLKYKSYIQETNSNEQVVKFYNNKDFKDLLCISKVFNNEDGNIEEQINFEVEHSKWNSTRFIKDKNTNNIIYQEWFNEKDFKDFGCSSTLEYNQNGSYIEKVFYGDILKKDCYNEIVYYSETGQKLKREYYTDKDYKELFASEKYEYGKNSMYSKVIYEKPYKQNILSAIEYSDKNNKRYYAVAYTDNDFKNIYRKTWVKYPKDGKMFLRIYAEKQNGYYSEIEKFDKNKNLIYKHQYKFKGILPKIFFCLSW